MANATLTFTIKELGRGLNVEETDPSNRRLRVSYSVFAKTTGRGTPPTLSRGELVLKVSLKAAERDPCRFPRVIDTPDAKPGEPPNGKSATAILETKSLESGFQAWTVDVEVPLLFATKKSQTVSAELSNQGKVVATAAARDWNPVALNQKSTRKLTQKSETFPRLSKLICETRNESFTKDLSGYNYLESTDELQRLTDLTEELFCRVAGGCSFLWSTFRPDPENSSLYGGYAFRLRELWAFYDYPEAPPEFLGNREQQQISVANEAWARAITELVCFMPYYGTGPGYYESDKRTIEIDDDGECPLEVRSHIEYDLAEGVSGSGRRKGCFYPIVAACQQLTTLALLSRGWYLQEPAAGRKGTKVEREMSLNAGSAAAQMYTHALMPAPGTWVGSGQTHGVELNPRLSGDALLNWLGNDSIRRSPDARALVTLTGENNTAFGPGSVAVFSNSLPSVHGYETRTQGNPPRMVALKTTEIIAHQKYLEWREEHPTDPDPSLTARPDLRKQEPTPVQLIGTHLGDNSGAAHIGTILRVDPNGRRYQVLDTGALNTNTSGDTGVWRGLPAIYDYPETTGDMHSLKDPCRGIGLAPVLDASGAQSLYGHLLSVVHRARPLGFMRLIVARRNVAMQQDNVNDWLLYASPLLRMYSSEDTSRNRATYADLVWSLRDFPVRDQVRLIWSIRLPMWQLADAMIDEPRTSTVSQLVAATQATLLSRAANSVQYTPEYAKAQSNVRLYCTAADIVAAPGAQAADGEKRAWLVHQTLGAAKLAEARLLSKFTRVCFDMELNEDGAVSRICAINAHGEQGYSGKLPQWHIAENGHGSFAHRLQFPLHCESSGSWEATSTGVVAWQNKVAQLRASVATRLIERFG